MKLQYVKYPYVKIKNIQVTLKMSDDVPLYQIHTNQMTSPFVSVPVYAQSYKNDDYVYGIPNDSYNYKIYDSNNIQNPHLFSNGYSQNEVYPNQFLLTVNQPNQSNQYIQTGQTNQADQTDQNIQFIQTNENPNSENKLGFESCKGIPLYALIIFFVLCIIFGGIKIIEFVNGINTNSTSIPTSMPTHVPTYRPNHH